MWLARVWFWLGFGIRTPPSIDTKYEGRADQILILSSYFNVPLRDRLRILISGKVHVCWAISADVIPTKAEAKSVFSVLHPGYKIPSSAQ